MIQPDIRVIGVLENLSDENKVNRIKKFCLEKKLQFSTRLFNRNKSEDATQITKLPAFHIYVKNGYTSTFYLDSRAYKHIKDGIELFTKKEAQREKRLAAWVNLYHSFKKSINRIFNKSHV